MLSQVVELNDSATGASARILASLGFNCFEWQPVVGGTSRDVLWSAPEFSNGKERPSGSGIPLLFPFPGRISGAKFSFAKRVYELQPGDAFGNAIHGFVLNRPWRLVEQSDARAVGEFQASVDDPSILGHWPADFLIRVAYEVRGHQLISSVLCENTGNGPLPFGFGTHAYFRLPLVEGSYANDTIVTAPVRQSWELADMIPTGDKAPDGQADRLAQGLRLDDHEFDTVFAELKADDDGLYRTVLRDVASGCTLTQSFSREFTQCVIYTPPHREAICLEPYTMVPDAFRLSAKGLETGLQVLDCGKVFETHIVLEVA